MRLDFLENAVLIAIQKHIELVKALEEVMDNIHQAPVVQSKSNGLKHLLKCRQQELEKTEDLISGLYIDWKNGNISHKQYRKMKEKFEQQEIQLKETLEHIEDEICMMGEGMTSTNPYLQAFLKHKNIQELSQEILVELIDAIYIHENEALTIQFKQENQYIRIVDAMEKRIAIDSGGVV